MITRAFGDLLFLNDDVKNKNYDIYRLGRRLDRVRFAFLFFSKNAGRTRAKLRKFYLSRLFQMKIKEES